MTASSPEQDRQALEAAAEGTLLWEPSEERKRSSRIAHYMRWLSEKKGKTFGDYRALWQWSVEDLESFWASIW